MIKKMSSSCLKAILLLLLLPHFQAFGQTRSVSGIIKDENGQPLPGIHVTLKGSSVGTVSDANGAYTLSPVQDSDILVFTYIGYKPKEEAAGSRGAIDLQMELDSEMLSEVVVVGYGTVKKSDLTGSVSSVKGEALKEFPVVSVDQALQARAAGVQVTQSSAAPGGGLSVRIRGSNSINAGSEPLYVIDGFPIYPDNAAIGTGANRQPTNAMASLNPNDIESIEVLKDASATSIYGSRGSNGVVLITTKRGKEGTLRINYDGSFSAQTIAKNVEMMNAADFERYLNILSVSQSGSPGYSDAQIAAVGNGTNWMKEITKTGLISNHQLSFSGGNKTSRYAFITNYLDNKGIILNTNFTRYGFRINLDNDFFNGRATLSNSWSFNRSSSSNVPTDRNGPGGIVMIGLGLDPTLSPYNDKGGYNYPSYDQRFNINPIAEAKEGYDHDFTNRLFGTTAITFRITKNLQFKTSLGADVVNSERTTFYNSYTYLGRQYNRSLTNAHRDATNLLNENILTYEHEIAEGQRLTATAGYTNQREDNKFNAIETRNLASDDVEAVKLQDGSSLQTPSSNRASWSLASLLARVNYSYKERYLFTLTVRRDGSSKFGENNKWATFPSAAFGWRIANEQFFQNSGLKNVFDDVKIRISYGLTGNSQLPVYQSQALLSSYNYILGNGFVTGFGPGSIANPDLKWESTKMLNVGFDFAVLKNRLTFTVDAFENKTSDLLLNISIPGSTGFNSILLNSGSLTNRGLEFTASGKVIHTKKLSWDISGNLSVLRNKITDLGKSSPFFSSPGWHLGIFGSWVEAGYPIGVWRGYNYTGLFQSDAEGQGYSSKAGYPKYEDVNNDGQYTEDDFKIIGNPNPNFIFGFNSTLKYNNFDLAIFIRGVQGNQVRNLQQSEIGDGVQKINQLKNMLTDSWTPQNPNASRPVIDGKRDFIAFRRSSYFIQDGSFIRLQNLALGYTIPIAKGNRSLRVYVSGQNLFLVTKYTGFDPEVNNQGQSALIRGDDYDAYPRARTYTVGVNLGL